jgi:hypothetical protein
MSDDGQLDMLDALEAVEAAADEGWLRAAKQAVWVLCLRGESFTTDDVWEHLDALGVTTHEPRALGAVMRAAATAGFIRKSNQYVNTRRPAAHSRPIPQWFPTPKAKDNAA